MALADGDERKPGRAAGAGGPGRRSPDERAGRRPAPRAGADSGFLPEILRRGLTLGFTGFFLTEEALRRALGDSVPRDWLEFFVEQSERTRAELLDRLSREFGRVISAFDPVEILRRLLDGQTLEVSARIRLANGERARRARRRAEREVGAEREEGAEPGAEEDG
jgi:hypothetical protein